MVEGKSAQSRSKEAGENQTTKFGTTPSGEKYRYEIKVEGHLDKHWSAWLGDFEITHDAQGNSLLTGSVLDQAALHGILVQIRDLGLTLLSLTRTEIEVTGRSVH